eukprot:gene52495-71599_t
MFLSLWTKYLPVIHIVLKKTLAEDQLLPLNKLEFQSVDNRKNANHSFNIEIINGKVQNGVGSATIGKDFFTVINNDNSINAFMADKTIWFTMGKNYQLTLKTEVAQAVAVEEEAIAGLAPFLAFLEVKRFSA